MEDNEALDETVRNDSSEESPEILSIDSEGEPILDPKDWVYFLQNEKNSTYGYLTSILIFIMTIIVSLIFMTSKVDASPFEWIILGLILVPIFLLLIIYLAKQFDLFEAIVKHSSYEELIERIINKEIVNSNDIKTEYHRIKERKVALKKVFSKKK